MAEHSEAHRAAVDRIDSLLRELTTELTEIVADEVDGTPLLEGWVLVTSWSDDERWFFTLKTRPRQTNPSLAVGLLHEALYEMGPGADIPRDQD